jgi:hypothetical protein
VGEYPVSSVFGLGRQSVFVASYYYYAALVACLLW